MNVNLFVQIILLILITAKVFNQTEMSWLIILSMLFVYIALNFISSIGFYSNDNDSDNEGNAK